MSARKMKLKNISSSKRQLHKLMTYYMSHSGRVQKSCPTIPHHPSKVRNLVCFGQVQYVLYAGWPSNQLGVLNESSRKNPSTYEYPYAQEIS